MLESGLFETFPEFISLVLSPLKLHVRALVQEMDSIQAEQKVVSSVSEKAKWWEGRRSLDSRLQVGGAGTQSTPTCLGSQAPNSGGMASAL